MPSCDTTGRRGTGALPGGALWIGPADSHLAGPEPRAGGAGPLTKPGGAWAGSPGDGDRPAPVQCRPDPLRPGHSPRWDAPDHRHSGLRDGRGTPGGLLLGHHPHAYGGFHNGGTAGRTRYGPGCGGLIATAPGVRERPGWFVLVRCSSCSLLRLVRLAIGGAIVPLANGIASTGSAAGLIGRVGAGGTWSTFVYVLTHWGDFPLFSRVAIGGNVRLCAPCTPTSARVGRSCQCFSRLTVPANAMR